MAGNVKISKVGEEMNDEIVISIKNLHKSFGDLKVLIGIDLEVKKGEIIGVIGPSGSGKSTLLRCINLLEVPNEGQIIINNSDITKDASAARRVGLHVAMVFQHFNLFQNFTVIKNLMYAPTVVKKEEKQQLREKCMKLLERVGLSDKANTYPQMLSGGQQQRVAIARALAMEPEVILFDEPTSALDPEMISEVLDVIKDLAKTGITMILVTHEMGFAREISNRIIFMDEGMILEDCSTKEFFSNPESGRAKDFLKKMLL